VVSCAIGQDAELVSCWFSILAGLAPDGLHCFCRSGKASRLKRPLSTAFPHSEQEPSDDMDLACQCQAGNTAAEYPPLLSLASLFQLLLRTIQVAEYATNVHMEILLPRFQAL
jgi:hypothetical protein